MTWAYSREFGRQKALLAVELPQCVKDQAPFETGRSDPSFRIKPCSLNRQIKQEDRGCLAVRSTIVNCKKSHSEDCRSDNGGEAGNVSYVECGQFPRGRKPPGIDIE